MNLCNPEGFKNEIKSNIGLGKDSFFSWFDGGDTVNGAFKKAEDIFNTLSLPWIKKHLIDVEEKTSLDIGYGSGGQVLAASKHFKYALGVDVHEEIETVERELKKRNKQKNIALFTGDGKTLPIDDNKVDFVSSWVTFLHMGTIEVVESYLKEMYRVMKEGGIAVIFFTRLIRSKKVQNIQEYDADVFAEGLHPIGYREGGPLTRVNRANIVISRWKMEELVKKYNFKLLNTTFSHDGDLIYGQHGIVFQKPQSEKSKVIIKVKQKKLNIKQSKKGRLMSKLSVVIPFVNEFPQIMFTVQAIAQSLLGRIDFEIIAVNNYCEEVTKQNREQDKGGETIKVCQRGNPWLKYLEYTDKLSHWQSKNLGVQNSTGDILGFVDAHCAITRNALFEMFNYYIENEDKINGSLHLPLTYKILEWHRLIYKLAGEPEKGDLHYSFTGYRAADEPYEVPCMSTCGMMISRKIYDELGGWPVELGIYGGGENFINYTLAVLGMKKWIMTGGHTLFHHGEKRGYHWNGDDMIRNRFIANYMFGGDKWLSLMKENRKGKKEVLQNIYEDVKATCKEHRELIKSRQAISIEEWLTKWR